METDFGSWLNPAEDRQFEPLEVAVCMQEADLAKPLDLHFDPFQNIVSLIGTTAVFRLHKGAVFAGPRADVVDVSPHHRVPLPRRTH